MGRILVTGDLHGKGEIAKLNSKNFPVGKELTKEDYVIILGDFGLVWNNDDEDMYWRNWLNSRNWTTLVVDGNHENFDLINAYPVEQWNGGKIHRIESSILHLMRGQVFTINGTKFMTMGGGFSIDKQWRVPGKSWWSQELPSLSEYKELIKNLKANSFEVDYVLTHTCPLDVFTFVVNNYKELGDKQLERFFLQLKDKLKFKHWYFGHFHMNKIIDDKHRCFYNDILEVQV